MNEVTLTDWIADLIESLRIELQHYGEVLALLEQQQGLVVGHSAEAIVNSAGAISRQMTLIQKARAQREDAQDAIASGLGQQSDLAFGKLVPLFPEKYRSAVGTLLRENDELCERVARRVRQNQLLLSRASEMMQQFLVRLAPHGQAAPRDESRPFRAIA